MTADDAGRPPEVIRRREVRHTSARSLLMTVLGEFVLPAGRPVWTWVLVDTLAAFGVAEKSKGSWYPSGWAAGPAGT
jgi:phenylacetic acid degradation operon negative regulatory protein